jgi:hypothetical protein
MKSTAPQLNRILAGLKSLDGLRTSQSNFEPFNFHPDVTWAIAENQCKIADAIKPYDLAKKTLASKHSVTEGMALTTENAEAVQSFLKELGELDERELDVDLTKIKRTDLKVGNKDSKGQNPIPASVLASIMPLLQD